MLPAVFLHIPDGYALACIAEAISVHRQIQETAGLNPRYWKQNQLHIHIKAVFAEPDGMLPQDRSPDGQLMHPHKQPVRRGLKGKYLPPRQPIASFCRKQQLLWAHTAPTAIRPRSLPAKTVQALFL